VAIGVPRRPDAILAAGRRGTRAARVLVALALLSGAFNLGAVVGPYREFERLVFDPGCARRGP